MKSLFALTGLFFLIACGQASENGRDNPANAASDSTQQQEQQTEVPAPSQPADPVDATRVIKNLQAILDGFKDPNNADAYAKFHEDLSREFNPLIQNLAADAGRNGKLYDFLLPVNVMIEWVGAPDMETRKKGYSSLKEYLPRYFDYFK
ncbi:MAG TPA: hypothetical protein VFX48_06380 [Saprospiraceae bacterium]|nr:hypothetical protein [Saprospiraceae bacterium]